jgi:hypothetical protein
LFLNTHEVTLPGVERQVRGMAWRAKIDEDLEKRLATGLVADEAEAVAVEGERKQRRDEARQGVARAG